MQRLCCRVPGRMLNRRCGAAIHFNDTLNMETAVSQWLNTLDANKNFTRK